MSWPLIVAKILWPIVAYIAFRTGYHNGTLDERDRWKNGLIKRDLVDDWNARSKCSAHCTHAKGASK